MTEPRLAVCIVTHDDADDLPGCLEAVTRLAEPAGADRAALAVPIDVAVVDCASADDSVARARAFAAGAPELLRVQVLPLGENRGFAGGMNAAIAATRGTEIHRNDWVLTLNPDARPAPEYVVRLIAAADAAASAGSAGSAEGSGGLKIGAVTGRLIRSGSAHGEERMLDACGMHLTRAWRHHDRGSGEIDRGQYDRPERVFGATGAASLFRREALEDVAFDDGASDRSRRRSREVFDERFHTFREDAELAFRLHERGWEVLYEPGAECLHRRFNLPARRSAMPAMVNFHSLKNRYLLRAYHQTPGNALRTAPWAIGRDLAALLYVLAREHTSLAAYRWLWRHRHEILARRRFIQSRRTVSPQAIDRWFHTRGFAVDLPPRLPR